MCNKILWPHEAKQVKFTAEVEVVCVRYMEFLEKNHETDKMKTEILMQTKGVMTKMSRRRDERRTL